MAVLPPGQPLVEAAAVAAEVGERQVGVVGSLLKMVEGDDDEMK